jgi:hypothetical protein
LSFRKSELSLLLLAIFLGGKTYTYFIIDYHDIPAHKRKEICHTMVVCGVRPDKDDPDRTRITIGGNRICFPGDVGTNTTSLELFKLLLNSVLSCKGTCFSSIDLKNFYLDTPMPDPEYVRIKITDIPAEFMEEYKLAGTDPEGWIYFEIRQGCYGLPQAGILANDLQVTSKTCSLTLNIPVQSSHVSPLTSACQSPMERRPSSPQKQTPPSYSTNTVNAAFKTLSTHFSTMPERSTTNFW